MGGGFGQNSRCDWAITLATKLNPQTDPLKLGELFGGAVSFFISLAVISTQTYDARSAAADLY